MKTKILLFFLFISTLSYGQNLSLNGNTATFEVPYQDNVLSANVWHQPADVEEMSGKTADVTFIYYYLDKYNNEEEGGLMTQEVTYDNYGYLDEYFDLNVPLSLFKGGCTDAIRITALVEYEVDGITVTKEAQPPITIKIKAYPPVSLTASSNKTICKGTSTSLSANASGGFNSSYTYRWTGGSINRTGKQVTVSPTTTTTYTVTATDCMGKTASEQVTVYVEGKPTLSWASPTEVPVFCIFQETRSVTINSSYPGPYNWTVTGDILLEDPITGQLVTSITSSSKTMSIKNTKVNGKGTVSASVETANCGTIAIERLAWMGNPPTPDISGLPNPVFLLNDGEGFLVRVESGESAYPVEEQNFTWFIDGVDIEIVGSDNTNEIYIRATGCDQTSGYITGNVRNMCGGIGRIFRIPVEIYCGPGSMESQRLSVYPNPTNHDLNITFEDVETVGKKAMGSKSASAQTVKAVLYNTLQQKVLEKDFKGTTKLDVSGLPKGTYYMKIYHKKGVETKQVRID